MKYEHITVNVENRYPCNQCDFVAGFKSSLQLHKKSNVHKVAKTVKVSENFDKKLSPVTMENVSNLEVYSSKLKDVVPGITYSCDLCDFVSAFKSRLMLHKKFKHKSKEVTVHSPKYEKVIDEKRYQSSRTTVY